MNWTSDELAKVDSSDELRLQSMRKDGSLRNPVTMWVVKVGDNLFVRSVKGRGGPWFKGTQDSLQGHVSSGGVDRDVSFEEAILDETDEIDAAYRSKYQNYSSSIVDHVLTPQAREATLKLVPR